MHFDVQVSDCQEVRWTAKDDWKSDMVKLGEQSAMTTLTTLMLVLSAIVLDLGSYICLVHSRMGTDLSKLQAFHNIVALSTLCLSWL